MSLAESTPPAMPHSISPAGNAVRHLHRRGEARAAGALHVVGRRLRVQAAAEVHSRARFQSRECLMTAPAATSPSLWFSREYLFTREAKTAVSICWLLASLYAVLARAKGMRTPPTMATRRGDGVMGLN